MQNLPRRERLPSGNQQRQRCREEMLLKLKMKFLLFEQKGGGRIYESNGTPVNQDNFRVTLSTGKAYKIEERQD